MAAYAVLFLEPLNPDEPAFCQINTFPYLSEIVTCVLLKVDLICATAFVSTTFFFFFCLFSAKILPQILFYIAFFPKPIVLFLPLRVLAFVFVL